MKHKGNVIIIRKSCLTGKVVWIYIGPSRAAGHFAYWWSRRKEEQRIRQWGERMSMRRANILRLLNACMEAFPTGTALTPEQNEAARQLLSISKKDAVCDMEFYNHFQEERRRRNAMLKRR